VRGSLSTFSEALKAVAIQTAFTRDILIVCSKIYCNTTQNEALYGGLVGHWELGDTFPAPCTGDDVTDHGGADWTLSDGETISGKGEFHMEV